ncbi:hypothetical protein K440DRAFT_659961 [Wilcoxina mikolae CBS 423.85]|nr:hypothetical protein K440DRAFT_659961 [Wilcoxina mikolae CBS 423.85]
MADESWKEGYKYNGTEWATKSATHFEEPGVEYSVDLTLYVSASDNSQAQIEFRVSKNVSEPQPEPIRRATMGSTTYDTAAVRKQLVIGHHDARDRGIFSFTKYELEKDTAFSNVSNLLDNSLNKKPSDLVALTSAHPIYRSILDQALEENDYYDHLQFVNVSSIVKVQTVQSVVPTGKMGLYIVYGIITLHFASVVVVLWLFFSSQTPKFLDQAWQTVSQLHRGDANKILDDATNIGDREIGLLPSAAGRWDKLVEISSEEKKTVINCRDSTSYSAQEDDVDESANLIQEKCEAKDGLEEDIKMRGLTAQVNVTMEEASGLGPYLTFTYMVLSGSPRA